MRSGESWEYTESHPCDELCGLGTPEESIERRRELRCSLPGFDITQWGPATDAYRVYMGRFPIVGQDVPADVDPRKPPEDCRDGCPGGWYRSSWMHSLGRYERPLSEGGFSPSLFPTSDRLILEALQYLEAERLRARAHWQELRTRELKK